MAIKNYTNETYLKTLVPELTRYLWSTESNFDGFKQAAEQVVLSDFLNRGLKVIALRPDLDLRTSTDTLSADETGVSYEDIHTRLRCVYNVTVRTGTTELVLQGSEDEITWNTIKTESVTATGEGSFVFIQAYKYYRINATISAGTLAFTSYLTESNYDLFFAYYWLYLILINAGKGNENKYTEYANVFLGMYNSLWANGVVVENNTKQKTSIVRMGR